MAIVINGSGTVTGISVGGLPDDIVDAGMMADDAVGTDELANDVAISTSGAITTTGAFTSIGINDDATENCITITSNELVTFSGGLGHTGSAAGETVVKYHPSSSPAYMTIADEATYTTTFGPLNPGAVFAISTWTNSSLSCLGVFAGEYYDNDVIMIANGSGRFAVTDTDGYLCVTKVGNANGNLLIKNRLGLSARTIIHWNIYQGL